MRPEVPHPRAHLLLQTLPHLQWPPRQVGTGEAALHSSLKQTHRRSNQAQSPVASAGAAVAVAHGKNFAKASQSANIFKEHFAPLQSTF